MANSLIPDPTQEVVIGPELGAELEQRVFAPARAAGIDAPLVGVTDPPPPVEVRPSPRGTWYVANHSDIDLVMTANGGVMPAPSEVIEHLRTIRAAGIDFQFVYILHEFPGEWTPGTPPPATQLIQASGGSAVAKQQATFEFGRQLLRAAATAAGMAAKGAVKVGAGAATLAAGAVSAITVDPVILGGVEDPATGQIAWIKLAQWDEEVVS